MLNKGKGPAVWSPRAQCDRGKFIWEWRSRLDHTDNLDIWQDQAEELIVENGIAVGVKTIWGVEFRAGAVVLTAGTFLNGLMHIGHHQVPGGRVAEPASYHLTESITKWGVRAGRMKTGTPVRLDKRTIHFEDTEEQPGDTDWHQFSYMRVQHALRRLPCWTCNTNEEVHRILRDDIANSPLFNGQIRSTGPRYCPSIETKLMVFPDRDHHLLFIEPEGENTNEMYLNGFSSSMPMETQLKAIHQIPAFRDVRAYRPGYAIEYDYFDPTQLSHSLESKIIPRLFLAGQVNGTTGYEEAAGQGLMAGVNAALRCAGSDPFILKRDEAYIGVLIDDLCTKGVDEPYRMFTSRAEYRILLRQDDADARLTEKAYAIGLAKKNRYDRWMSKKAEIRKLMDFCDNTSVHPKEINNTLEAIDTTPLQFGCKIVDLIARPQLSIPTLSEIIPDLKMTLDAISDRKEEIIEAAEVMIKYKGYIEREKIVAEKMHRLENIKIKGHFHYTDISEISTEGRQKLERIDPDTLAEASRIPGVSPSDINVLLVLLGR